ncbi:MAG: BolA family protein [Ghiorsea sp.]
MSGDKLIQTVLEHAFQPSQLKIIDESYKHAGHAGAKDGGGHFIVQITSSSFEGKSRIQRHRMVNDVTAHLFGETIHALSIQAKTPKENL